MDSRRWEPGDLAFQGGTCLHMAHGSARFSEDLDFMIRGGVSLDGLAGAIQRRLRLPPGTPQDLAISVTPGRGERNPHAFMVTLSGPGVIGSAKVKIELWQTDAAIMKSLQIMVSTITSPAGIQTFVPAITLDEIVAAKVYALGARDHLKPRDVFDLWWLLEHRPTPTLWPDMLRTRLDIYPRGSACDTARRWLKGARARLDATQAASTVKAVAQDLKRWLPSSWAMSEPVAAKMLAVSLDQLRAGVQLIQTFEADCSNSG